MTGAFVGIDLVLRYTDTPPIAPKDLRTSMPYNFIVTQTPLRISFAGGGTDLKAFYSHEGGQVVSTTIDKYLYVTVKRHNKLLNPEAYRLNYSELGACRHD